MVFLTIILVQVLCCLYQSPKYYIEIWHERPFSLHRDRERELLSEAGGSFCFPLMEKDLMASGLTNMLESAQDLSLKAFMAARCAAR